MIFELDTVATVAFPAVEQLKIRYFESHPGDPVIHRATMTCWQQHALLGNFGGRIAEILEAGKYNRSPQGRIEGWGPITAVT